ncbi:PilZ domain-containing protein [Gellertiella hungarica]|uniref:PilZ domain-containing protein n=1 Tax=Gellertiella hungarica TaxID=1572859 RepID=A0A7W6J3U4_9HYPH|nr:PilZ domain-containing protein [Gellertiella hungarica]MBB4064294.1 hypothetical protein [Gellertiella hungarica]
MTTAGQAAAGGIKARKEARSEVRLFGRLKYMNAEIMCRVVNLSEQGIGLALEQPREMTPGIPVSFYGKELGHLNGTVSWYRNGTVGVRLKHTSSTYAQVASYFRFFHEDMKPMPRVLR